MSETEEHYEEVFEQHDHHETSFYVKIWAMLVVLLAISVAGPHLGIKWVTLLTAFGIALVKAYMVAVNFMHLNLTPRFVTYLVTTTLVFMLLFFAGAAPDVMEDHGTNWIKPAWIAEEAAYAAEEVHISDAEAAEHGHEPAGAHGEQPAHH
jgi:caa(3)-type oxidase subunit IV